MQANKGWISELLNEVGMSHLGEAWDSHTQQAEVRNQLLWPSASTRKSTMLSDPILARTLKQSTKVKDL